MKSIYPREESLCMKLATETGPTHYLVFRIHQLSFPHHLFADVESLLQEATNTPTGAIQ